MRASEIYKEKKRTTCSMSVFISDSVFVSGKRNRTRPKHFRLGHRRTGTFGLGGAVTFLPEKFTQFLNIQPHSNCTKNKLVHKFTMWQEIFRRSLIPWILDFSGFAGKKIMNCIFESNK